MEMWDGGYSTNTTETYHEVTTYVPVSGREYLKMNQNQRRIYEKNLFDQLDRNKDSKNAHAKVIEHLDITQDLINEIEWGDVDYPAKDHDDLEILHERLSFKRLDLEDEIDGACKESKGKTETKPTVYGKKLDEEFKGQWSDLGPPPWSMKSWDSKVNEINILINKIEKEKMHEHVFDIDRVQMKYVDELVAVYKRIPEPTAKDHQMLQEALDHIKNHLDMVIKNYKEKLSDDLEIYRNFLGIRFNFKGFFG